ncbi:MULTISPECIES: phenylalanine--tRNA ligase subunit beta [Pseudomonadaceae]|jgi:phenylalanyl-tRNA synthetase beta chain|uniref:Phenylalanine--tRNA ligase beta subunit n=1 Tax=Ectopseudomonas oleovorans TaxID=301 RepID=A0A653B041_ECTOL|nr:MULTISPECIES: phenylalanine--tRNA ligase subunit beta [Pseudomonas]UZZ09868.1 phenylalanine--tRNA ligase subunit beta [Pseudomonas mendocina]WJH58406.1 phenylalanine--tRNA ligase subunit beta [Pseudomonas guguanensis]CAE6947929.1 Phenylalanine--tRNA ligase beta subunit [Pseudomonas oleovorans]
MKILYSWLSDWLTELPEIDALSEILTSIGLSVERVEKVPGCAVTVRCVEVVETDVDTQRADTVHLTISDGSVPPFIVTEQGFFNVGDRLAYDFSRFGEAGRQRRICKFSDLWSNLPDELIRIGVDVSIGSSLKEIWVDDYLIELELTPNRADALCVLGVARDLSAKLGSEASFQQCLENYKAGNAKLPELLSLVPIHTSHCSGCIAATVPKIVVGPSKLSMQRRLMLCGFTPINNVVDASNLVMLELGQPSHCYDASGVSALTIRNATSGERLVVLGGDEITLSPDDIVVSTSMCERPLSLAGVIGGEKTKINVETTSVILEVATFDPSTIRRIARRHKMGTDASYRFERGVDPSIKQIALARLVALLSNGRDVPIKVWGGGSTAEFLREPIQFRPSQVEFLAGFDVSLNTQARLLTALGCNVESTSETWFVTPPSWRYDLEIEADLIEEVLRLVGYDNIPETRASVDYVPVQNDLLHEGLKRALAVLGFQEVINYVFIAPDTLDQMGEQGPYVTLESALNTRTSLRTTLLPGLIEVAKRNKAESSLAIFEVGNVFVGDKEEERLALLIRGGWLGSTWGGYHQADFSILKGVIETLATLQGVRAEVVASVNAIPVLHPGVSGEIRWGGNCIGCIGRLHPKIEGQYKTGPLYIAELRLPLPKQQSLYREFSRQPAIERDLAIITPANVPFAEVERLVRDASGEDLDQILLFDRYEGEQIESGKISLGLRLVFRRQDRSMRDDSVDILVNSIVAALSASGLELR